MGKAQAAVELTVLLALMMIVLLFIFEFGENRLIESNSMLQVSQARNTVDRLAKAVTDVHNEGVGARRSVYIQIPDRVNPSRVNISNTIITIGVYALNGTSDISAPTDFPVVRGGFFPTTPGSYWVWVISKQGYVQVGSSFSATPLNVYAELFPTNSSSTNITVTSLSNSTINVTANLTWSDSEINATINGTNNMSFLLPLGSSYSNLINLTVAANTNASFGLHNGYLSVTTNVSDSEAIPILVNVVSPPPAMRGISYLALDTYNDSAYTYSTASFLQYTSVYYSVKSYNSSNNLTNSTVTVRVYSPSSILMSQQTYSPNSTGTYQSGYYLLPSVTSGSWKITAYDIGGVNTATYFTIPQYPGYTILGSTTLPSSTPPFHPNQRAICRDSSNYVHIVWLYNSSKIMYAKSINNGLTFSVNSSFYGNVSTETSGKVWPSISCDGGNITVAYTDTSSSKIIVGISTNNGNSWNWSSVASVSVTSSELTSVERRGQRVYVVYETGDIGSDYHNINFTNSTDGGSTWGPKTAILTGTAPVGGEYYRYSYSSIAVNGTGTSSDKIYIAAQSYYHTGYSDSFYIYFINSSNAGATWGSLKYILGSQADKPSITTNGSAVFITTTNYSSPSNRVILNTSLDGGATWSGEQASVGTNGSGNPTVTLNGTMPFILWRNNTLPSTGNIFYRNYNGSGWDNAVQHTNIQGSDYPNAKWNYAGNCIEFVYENGTASPYNITYSPLGSCAAAGNVTAPTDITPPTFSLNSTNSTSAGTSISHNLYWQDNYGLSGYTFQFCDGINCRGNSGNWANSTFTKCQNITITNAGTSTLTNFPAYINLSYNPGMLSNYQDLRFYSSSCNNGGSLLDYEIDSYTANNANIWVRIPSLPTTGTTISVYYKNNTVVESGENKTGVWDDNYVLVAHFSETTGNHSDSTKYQNNATQTFVSSQGNATIALIGRADEFNSTNINYVNFSNISMLNPQNFTLEAWSKMYSYTSYARIISKEASTTANPYAIEWRSATQGEVCVQNSVTPTEVCSYAPSGMSVNTWYYMVGVYNSTHVSFWYNMTAATSSANTYTIPSLTTKVFIGSNSAKSRLLNGIVDEIRISNISRSADWLNETYQLVINQTSFVSFGNKENLWVNNTWVSMTGLNNWSNVTKIISSTVGDTISWCVYSNDTSNNLNATSCSTPFNYTTT